jgi:hypothetical protein
MTKNQLTIGLILAGLVIVVLMAQATQNAETINAQQQRIATAEFSWQTENQRANQLQRDNNRQRNTIESLEQQLRTLAARTETAS